MAKKILSIALALIMALSVFAVAASAAEIETTAESFENDYKTAANGDVIVLTEDVEIYGNKQTSKDITVDLAGHTITCTATEVAGLIASSKTGNLTITDSVGGGKIDSDFAALQAQTGATVVIDGGTIAGVRAVANFSSAGNVVVNDGVVNTGKEGAIYLNSSYSSRKPSCTVNGGEINGDVFTVANCVLTVNGGEFTSASYCIVGNGTKKNTEITINGGTFTATSETGAAIYHPQGGTLVINDGTFEGADALYIKAGTTTINGGEFVGTGAAKEYSYYGNGFNTTGDAIVVDSCGYPNGQPPFVRINDGEFSSDNAASIGVYTYGESTPATVFIYGGTFDDDAAETYAGPLAVNKTTGAYYETINLAVAAASKGDTVALMADTTVAGYQSLMGEDITIDLAGYEFTSTGNTGLDLYGSFTITDSVGGGAVSAVKTAVWVNPGTTLNIKAGTFNGAIRSDSEDSGKDTVVVIDDGTFNAGAQGDVVEAFFGGTAIINGGEFDGSVFTYGNGTLTINDGTFEATDYCVTTQGNDTSTDTTATINGGTFRGMTRDKKDGVAIFWPAAGKLVINGGSFTGSDALYIKSGNVEINGGIFMAVGPKTDWVHTGNGFNITGDTIVIESCGYPGGEPSLKINGGIFSSRNAEIIGYYVYGDNELANTGFVYGGRFEQEVPAEYWADVNAFDLLYVKNGSASYDATNDVVIITVDEGATKVEVLKSTRKGVAIFSDLTGGAKLSSGEQIYARENGTFVATIGEESYNCEIVFGHFDVEDLLQVTNATMTVENNTITLTPVDNDAQIIVSSATTAGTTVEFGARTGGAKVSSKGALYAKADGTAVVTVPNSGRYTVVFDFEEAQFALEASLIKKTNASVTIENNTIILTPVDDTQQVSMTAKLRDGSDAFAFSNLNGAKLSSAGSLYANKYATATATINGVAYTVVFDYEIPEVPLADNLRTVNATVEVDGTTIILTPIDETAQVNFINKLKDGTEVTFSNIDGAIVSSKGTLYAKKAATATATIDGTDYDVVFNFAAPQAKPVEELIKVKGATVEVEGTTITLTATAAQVNVYPTLTDGTTATFSALNGARVASAGTLYAKKTASAVMTINGVDYTVNFVF